MQTVNEIINSYPDVNINRDGAPDSYREGLPIVERHPVAVIIKHPSEDMYLIAKWKKVKWNGFLTGGIEEGDTLEDTVRKEIHEETGFRNVSKIVPMNYVSRALFFHPVKNINRLAHYHLVSAQLTDLEKDPVSEEESNIADFVWIPRKEVLGTLTRKEIKSLWDFYMKNPI